MAMALSALVLAPLLMGLNIVLKDWEEERIQSELLQHARVAMQRITSELRYASGIYDHNNPDVLTFFTRTLLDDDWAIEKIKYWREDAGDGTFLLYRGVDSGGGYEPYPIAGAMGSSLAGISVPGFVIKYFRLDGDNLNELASTEKDYLVDLVEVSLTLACGAKTVSLSSRIKLRNK